MPWGLKRYQQTGDIHFITFSCYRRAPLLPDPQARDTFVTTLESTARRREQLGVYPVVRRRDVS